MPKQWQGSAIESRTCHEAEDELLLAHRRGDTLLQAPLIEHGCFLLLLSSLGRAALESKQVSYR
jgi:hypothetical protein